MELNQVCFATLGFDEPWTLENYLKIGGYQAWEKILKERPEPASVAEEVKKSGLRGRGGGGLSHRGKRGFIAQTPPPPPTAPPRPRQARA